MAKRSTAKAQRRTADSNTYRFFVDPAAITGTAVALADRTLVHQLTNVLRLQPGQQITLLDDSGLAYTVELTALGPQLVQGTIVTQTMCDTEPQLRVTLYIALMRSERFEWALQKATELGAAAIVPVHCEHSPGDEATVGAAKLERWARIVREAGEQSRRGRLPALRPPQPFADASAGASGQRILLWESAGAQPLTPLVRATTTTDWAIFSGPEGGWSAEERTLAEAAGVPLVGLGPRTLRAETAPLAALVALLTLTGELG